MPESPKNSFFLMLKKQINKIAGIKNNKNCNSNLANKNNIVIKKYSDTCISIPSNIFNAFINKRINSMVKGIDSFERLNE